MELPRSLGEEDPRTSGLARPVYADIVVLLCNPSLLLVV